MGAVKIRREVDKAPNGSPAIDRRCEAPTDCPPHGHVFIAIAFNADFHDLEKLFDRMPLGLIVWLRPNHNKALMSSPCPADVLTIRLAYFCAADVEIALTFMNTYSHTFSNRRPQGRKLNHSLQTNSVYPPPHRGARGGCAMRPTQRRVCGASTESRGNV